MKEPHFFHVDTNSWKLKVVWKFFGWVWSKYGCGQSGLWTLKFAISQEWKDEINWFFQAGTNPHKLKGDWKYLGWAWPKMSVVSLVMRL